MNLISIKKKYFVFALIALTAIGLLITVRLAQQRQANQSKASAATTLSLTTSQSSVKKGDTFTVTLKVDPGTNLVSIIDYKVIFNPNTFEYVSIQNSPAFPIVLREPNASAAGEIGESVTIGSDVTKAVTAPTQVATITFKVIATSTQPVTESISINQAYTRVFSVAQQDNPEENVLSAVVPVQIAVTPESSTQCGLNSICGTVFVDPNKNGIQDNGEVGYSGVKVYAAIKVDATGTLAGSTTSDQNGKYSILIANPTSPTYSVIMTAPAGYVATNPAIIHDVTFATGNNRNFGIRPLVSPTPTTPVIANCGSATGRPDLCTCLINGIVNQCANTCKAGLGNSSTEGYCCPAGQQYCKATNSCTSNPSSCPDVGQTLSFSFMLPGIGGTKPGDNTNPKHPSRPVSVKVYDQYNQSIFSKDNLPAQFNGIEYKVIIPLTGMGGMSGLQVSLSTDNSLTKKVSSLISLSNPGNNVIPGSTMLVTGDIDHNNVVDLLDWNKLLSCHQTQQPQLGLGPCTAADLNDDGKIDEIDVNIFQRALAIREGDTVVNLFNTPTPTPMACPTLTVCPAGSHSVLNMPLPGPVYCQTNHCAPDQISVSIQNSTYSPSSITTEGGATIKFTNNDTVVHTVTADNGTYDSGDIQPGQSYVLPANLASGQFHCKYHPSMTGSINIIVQ